MFARSRAMSPTMSAAGVIPTPMAEPRMVNTCASVVVRCSAVRRRSRRWSGASVCGGGVASAPLGSESVSGWRGALRAGPSKVGGRHNDPAHLGALGRAGVGRCYRMLNTRLAMASVTTPMKPKGHFIMETAPVRYSERRNVSISTSGPTRQLPIGPQSSFAMTSAAGALGAVKSGHTARSGCWLSRSRRM